MISAKYYHGQIGAVSSPQTVFAGNENTVACYGSCSLQASRVLATSTVYLMPGCIDILVGGGRIPVACCKQLGGGGGGLRDGTDLPAVDFRHCNFVRVFSVCCFVQSSSASQLCLPSASSCIPVRTLTLNQYLKRPEKVRPPPKYFPQYKAVVVKVICVSPKKPNSGNRKCVRARLLRTNKEVTAFVPGTGHTLADHQVVLLRRGFLPDCIGVKYVCIRGKHDLRHVEKKEK